MSTTMFPVESSNLAAVGYVEDERVLYVTFRNGNEYRYFDVPPEKYAGIFEAPSAGAYFHSEIRPHHRAERIVRKEKHDGDEG